MPTECQNALFKWAALLLRELLQGEAFEFNFHSLGLHRDLAFGNGALFAVVDEVAIDPDFHFVALAFDDHFVPLADGLFGAVGEVENAAGVAFLAAPLLILSFRTSFLHVGDLDVLVDTPEISSIGVMHLYFNGGREHFVERAGSGRVNEDPAIARLGGEAVFQFEAIVLVGSVGDEVTAGFSKADEHAVSRDEAGLDVGVLVSSRNIGMPTFEVFAVEQFDDLILRRELGSERKEGGENENFFHDRCFYSTVMDLAMFLAGRVLSWSSAFPGFYSTVTDLARFRGWSMEQPLRRAMW